MRDRRGGIVDVDPVGPVRRLARHAQLPRAQPLDQLQPARPVQAGQPQHRRRQRLLRQPLLGLEQHPTVESRRVGRGGLVDPVAVVLAVHGAGRDEQHPCQFAAIERVEQVVQAVHEDRAVCRLVARRRGRQVDQLGDPGRQLVQAGRIGQVAAQPMDAVPAARRRPAPQRPYLVAARAQALRHAFAKIAASGQQDTLAHHHPPVDLPGLIRPVSICP